MTARSADEPPGRRGGNNRLSLAREAGLLALWAALVGVVMLRQSTIVWDDPYILMRYAENLVDGRGWTLNPRHRTDNAVTSPLMVVLLAALRLIRVPMLTASGVIHFVFTTMAAHLTWKALRSGGAPYGALIAGAVVATSPAFALMWGMESSVYIALVALVAVLGQTSTRLWDAGLAVGLLGLVRPEALLVGATVLLLLLWHRRVRPASRRQWSTLAAATLGPSVVWGVSMWIAAGAPVPSTLGAKRAQAGSGWWPTFGSWENITSRWPWGLRGQVASASRLGDVLVLVGAGLLVAGLVALLRRHRGWHVALAVACPALVITVVYARVLAIAAYPWYWTLPVYALVVCAALGADLVVCHAVGERFSGLAVGAAVLIVAAIGVQNTQSAAGSPRAEYDAIGAWLAANTADTSTVAAFEVGRIAWASDRTIVDPLGLLDARLARYVEQGDFTSWLAVTQPDYWVLSKGFIDAPLRESPCLGSSFVDAFSTPSFTVFERVAAIPPGDSCALR